MSIHIKSFVVFFGLTTVMVEGYASNDLTFEAELERALNLSRETVSCANINNEISQQVKNLTKQHKQTVKIEQSILELLGMKDSKQPKQSVAANNSGLNDYDALKQAIQLSLEPTFNTNEIIQYPGPNKHGKQPQSYVPRVNINNNSPIVVKPWNKFVFLFSAAEEMKAAVS